MTAIDQRLRGVIAEAAREELARREKLQEKRDYALSGTAHFAEITGSNKLMLDQGIYLPPSQFEAAFISLAHSDDDITRTIEAHRAVLQSL